MPALADRGRFEDAMAASLGVLLHQMAVASLHGSDAVDWDAAHSLTAATLLPSLIVIYMSAAEQAGRESGVSVDRALLAAAARDWAESHADELAADLNARTRAALEQHEREAVAQGVSVAVLLLAAIPSLFGVDRAKRVSVTETTRAVTAGETHVLGNSGRVAIWALGPSASGPCPVCRPLNGLRLDELPEHARGGPPLHEHCACHLLWQ